MELKNLCLGAKSTEPKNKPIDINNVKPTLLNTKEKVNKPNKRFIKDILRKVAVGTLALTMLFGGYKYFKEPYIDVGAPPTVVEKFDEDAYLNGPINIDINGYYQNSGELPNKEQVYKNLQTMGLNDKILTRSDEGIITRLLIDGKIRVGVSDEFTEQEKQVIKDCLATYNYIFSVVNPDYKFEYDDTLTEQETKDADYIQVNPIGKLEGSTLAYESAYLITRENANGADTVYNAIYMGDASRKTINLFRTTFLHEFMHALGVADAYLVENFREGTIMNSSSSRSKTNDLYAYDVALLACLYGDFNDPEYVERIKNFVATYGQESQYTDTSRYKSPEAVIKKRRIKTEEKKIETEEEFGMQM